MIQDLWCREVGENEMWVYDEAVTSRQPQPGSVRKGIRLSEVSCEDPFLAGQAAQLGINPSSWSIQRAFNGLGLYAVFEEHATDTEKIALLMMVG